MIACQIPVLLALGAYRGMWRYFGMMDAVVFGKSVALGTLASPAAVVLLNDGLPMPPAVFVIHAALLLLLLTGSRASFRLMTEFISRRAVGRRVVIYAMGGDEQFVVHRLATGEPNARRVLGFFEDRRERGPGTIEGYPISGDYDELLEFVAAGMTDNLIGLRTEHRPGAPRRARRALRGPQRHGREVPLRARAGHQPAREGARDVASRPLPIPVRDANSCGRRVQLIRTEWPIAPRTH